MIRRGDSGPKVEALQRALSAQGFDPPATFGPATEAAVRLFQKARGLLVDGLVGPRTLEALAETPSSIEIDRTSLRLSRQQYIPEERQKDLIVLHHTAGASAESTVRYWERTPERIGTAYLVERDGTIFEVFPPRCWAYHVGASIKALEQRSIGIEIASEGGLEDRGGELYAFGRPFRGEVYDHGEPWRGFRHFAAYTAQQMAAVWRLVTYLVAEHGIPARVPADLLAYRPALRSFEGIVGHHHLRADKSDVHPGMVWGEDYVRVR